MKQQIVHIVDDDEAVRDSMSMLLESANIAHLTYSSADEFLAQYDESQCGCLVLDIRMPGLSGLELQQQLRQAKTPIPIIFMTGHGDVPMAVKAMRDGAIDFMRKPIKEQNLLQHVQLAFEQDQREQDKQQQLKEAAKLFSSLTLRETQIFDLVALGETNKAIANQLDISERTVEVHRSSVMDKLNARTLAQLVRLAIEFERLELS